MYNIFFSFSLWIHFGYLITTALFIKFINPGIGKPVHGQQFLPNMRAHLFKTRLMVPITHCKLVRRTRSAVVAGVWRVEKAVFGICEKKNGHDRDKLATFWCRKVR